VNSILSSKEHTMTSDTKIRWGMIGCGKIGHALATAIRNSDLGVLRAVASRDLAKAQEWAQKYEVERAYGSYDELLADADVDAIYNPLPNSMHLEWTVKAAQAGKHILCEKPLASDAEEGQQIADACRENGVLLMEAFMWRHHPQQARVKEILGSGKIGEIKLVRAGFSYYLEQCDNIRWSKPLAGGALMDVGCYCVNASRFIFEEEPIAVIGAAAFDPDYEVDSTTTGVLEFSGGRFAAIDCGMLMMRRNCYEVIGTEGRLEVPQSFVPGTSDVSIAVTTGDGTETETIPGIDEYMLEADHFAKCLIEEQPLAAPAEDGVKNMKVIDALFESIRSGRRAEIA